MTQGWRFQGFDGLVWWAWQSIHWGDWGLGVEYIATGSATAVITEAQAGLLLDEMLAKLQADKSQLRRVLLLPPDITRFHSWSGVLTGLLYQRLQGQCERLVILPALGTHSPMTPAQLDRMFPGIPHHLFEAHDWRHGLARLGEVPNSVLYQLSEGKLDYPIEAAVAKRLVEEPWDAIISIGQLVPHEVIGIANQNKNVFVGTGGADIINKTHFLGAVYGMERIMGRAQTPVRDVLNYIEQHFASHLPICYLLTVRSRHSDGQLVTRGLFAGDDQACFLRGAELCRQVNLDLLEEAPARVVVYLDPEEFKSTWLGNKAIYRTRMALADGGELIVLAPGVREFGEDAEIDRLIRKYGYRGTPTTLAAVAANPELQTNLSAAAHLIHGSSEGRFTIRYCPGHLTADEITGVGFEFGILSEYCQRYPNDRLTDGWHEDAAGRFFYISNPGLGLWGTRARFAV